MFSAAAVHEDIEDDDRQKIWIASSILDEQGQIREEVPAPPILSLVLEGGGIKGIAYEGLVKKLQEMGFLPTIQNVAGSSIGAVAAMLIALGYQGDELTEALNDLDFNDFLESSHWSWTPKFIIEGKKWFSILNYLFLSSGNKMLEWLEKRVAAKLKKPNATFADLAAFVEANRTEDGQYPFKYLSVTGSNLTKDCLDVFNHECTPCMPISLAVRISASYPGVFKAVEWDNGQGVCLYIDGGVMCNLPYFIYRDEKYLKPLKALGYTRNKKGMNPSVLCAKIDMREEIDSFWNRVRERAIRGIASFSKAVMWAMQSRNKEISEDIPLTVIHIDDKKIDTLNFKAGESEKKTLRQEGEIGGSEYGINHVSEAYDVKVFPNQEAWLAAKSTEQIVLIRERYREMLKGMENLLQKLSTDGRELYAHTTEAIRNKVAWFDEYLKYRYQKTINRNAKPPPFLPHINLPPLKPRQLIDELIKAELRTKLSATQCELEQIHEAILNLKSEILHANEALPKDTCPGYVYYLVGLEEKAKLLEVLQQDLLTHLHLPAKKPYAGIPDVENYLKARIKSFDEFRGQIKERFDKKMASTWNYLFVLSDINDHLQNYNFQYPADDPIRIMLDLRSDDDLKLYILSLLLYLKAAQCKDDSVKIISNYYQYLFKTDVLPDNIEALGLLLGQDPFSLQTAAYRIQALMQHFSTLEYPKEKLLQVDLSLTFAAIKSLNDGKKPGVFKRPKAVNNAIRNELELDYSFQKTCSEKFSFFSRTEEITIVSSQAALVAHLEKDLERGRQLNT